MKNNTKKKIVLSIMLPASLMCAIGAATLHNALKPTFGETKAYFIEFNNTTNKFTGSGINGEVDYLTDEGHTITFEWGMVKQLEGGWAIFDTEWTDFFNLNPINGMTNISISIESPTVDEQLHLYYSKTVVGLQLQPDIYDEVKTGVSRKSFTANEDISFDFNKESPNYFLLECDRNHTNGNAIRIKSMRIDYTCVSV